MKGQAVNPLWGPEDPSVFAGRVRGWEGRQRRVLMGPGQLRCPSLQSLSIGQAAGLAGPGKVLPQINSAPLQSPI